MDLADFLWGGDEPDEPSADVALREVAPDGDRPSLTVRLGGIDYDLDDPLLDADRGVDSVAVFAAGGTTVYADLDGDGVVDEVTTVRAHGASGTWRRPAPDSAWTRVRETTDWGDWG